MDEAPNLNGCKFCAVAKLDHAMEWHPEKGWHIHHDPTDAQRKERWKDYVNQREARKRQQLIENTLAGLEEILGTNLHQEMDPEQEVWLIKLLALGEKWTRHEL